MAELPKPRSHTVTAIHAFHADKARVGHSNGIPISGAAEECERRLWYGFRWAYPPERHDGQRLRLFETGEREEARMVDELHAIGCRVSGEQERVTAIGGHLRGKLDGRAFGIPEAPATEHVIECKTHNEKSFKDLIKKGVQLSKPSHYAQTQLYMDLTGLSRALYMAHNKNTDELYTERLKHDPLYCMKLLAKLKRIVEAARPPSRLHEDTTSRAAWACNYCPAALLCRGGWAERNCRTCLHSTPVDGGWLCEARDNNQLLTREEQQAGCDRMAYIPDLVPLEQVDCDINAGTVTYRAQNGRLVVDGGPESIGAQMAQWYAPHEE